MYMIIPPKDLRETNIRVEKMESKNLRQIMVDFFDRYSRIDPPEHYYTDVLIGSGVHLGGYRCFYVNSFVTAVRVTSDNDVTLDVHLSVGSKRHNLSLGTISLKQGEPRRLPLIGKLNPLTGDSVWSIGFSRIDNGERVQFLPTTVVFTVLRISHDDMSAIMRSPRILRLTPTHNVVTDLRTVIIEQAEMGPWMRYGAFLWLLRKHYKDIITRLYRPGGLMAKRMEMSIYGPGDANEKID